MKKIAFQSLVAAAMLVAVAAPAARAADFHEGLAAYKRGDYEAALREWRPLAAQGDVESQYRLGRMYYHGEGVRDDAEAAKWYERAAARGHVRAQNNLGLLYEQGRGVERDEKKAAAWYRGAAEQGLATAQSNLARLYDVGLGVGQDHVEAAKWYRSAAEQGHAHAQYRLAVMLDEGTGVPSNPAKAAKWYRRAAKQGHGPAQSAIGSMYAEGRGVSRDVEKAAKWLGRASAQGIAVTVPFMEGPSEAPPVKVAEPEPVVATDSQPATSERAAEVAASAAALPEVDPSPVVDSVEAPLPAEPALESSPSPQGATRVPVAPPPPPRRKPAGRGAVPFDFPELQEISRRADDGDPQAQYRLAQMYSTGEGAPQNLDDAARWYLAAAEQGHEMAAYKLGFLYLRGRGVPRKDYVQAYRWFSVSAELGVGDARQWRDRIRRKMSDQEIVESEALVQAGTPKEQD
jgi:TPR repeat protein